MDKIERKIEKNCKKSQKLVNFRDEVLKDIQSYNNRCNSQGKQSVLNFLIDLDLDIIKFQYLSSDC